MGLIQSAIETYENSKDYIGKYESGKTPLEPLGYITTAADIEIMIDLNGKFISAKKLDKEKILIPITDASVSRSGKAINDNIHPHMLCDQLSYLGFDNEKCKIYINQLREWKNSEYSSPILSAVYQYILSGNIKEDITKICELEGNNKDSNKVTKIDEKWLVRWIVVIDGVPNKCWESKELIENYSKYYKSKINYKNNLCMITGEVTKVIDNNKHRKGIISNNGNAKLLSANDTSYFTYRGRFKNDEEAVTVSAIDISKASNALKWLAENQAVNYRFGNLTFLCWKPQGIKVSASPFDSLLGTKEIIKPSDYKNDLYKVLMGYQTNTTLSNVVIVCFGAATTGRLSINYYNELFEFEYYKKLEKWDEDCCWWQYKSNKYIVNSPDLKSIAKYAFGTYRKDSGGKNPFELKDEILGRRIQELLHCRIDNAKIPVIYVKALLNQIGKLFLYEKDNFTKWNLLFVTCSVIKKYYLDRGKGEFEMDKIEVKKNDISYHYGRLLAVLEKIERDTYSDEGKRTPNAIRVQSQFIQHPLKTFSKIQEQLNRAYVQKLSISSQKFYSKLISDIISDLAACDRYDELKDKPLKESYIIGYYLENKELYTKKNDNKEEEK